MTPLKFVDPNKSEDIFLRDDSGPTIAEHARECTELFQKRTASPDIVPDATIMDDQLARFNLWASNMDVFGPPNTSLDFRLRYSPNIVDILHQLLDVIHRALMELKPIINSPSTLSRKKRRITSSDQAQLVREDNEASDIDSDKDQAEKNTSLLTYTISGTVTRLFRLSNAIRKSAKASRAQKLKDYQVDEETQQAIDELRLYTDCYIRYRFPECPEGLRCTLVKANMLRLRRLSYLRLHKRRVALSISHPQAGQTQRPPARILEKPQSVRFAPEANPKSEAARKESSQQNYPPPPLTYATTAQQTEIRALYAKSTTEVPRAKSVLVNSELSFPPVPQQNECPYCGVIIEFRNSNKFNVWRTHVLRDLEPFLCLSTACTDLCQHDHEPLTFDTSKAWTSHMENSHGLAWECRAPSHKPIIFRDEIQFQKHSCDEHSVPVAHVRALSEAAQRPYYDKIYSCPFGDSFVSSEEAKRHGIFSYDDLQSHIAGHMKELALLALQKLPTDNEAETSDLASDAPLGTDGGAKLRGSMCSLLDGDELAFSDTAGDNQASDLKEGITLSIKNLDLEDIDQTLRSDALRLAIQRDDMERVRTLLDLATGSNRSRTKKPLHWAALYGKEDILRLLLESADQEDIYAKDENGRTPVHYAAIGGFVESIKLLIQAGASIESLDDYKLTPQLWAVFSGRVDAAQELGSLGTLSNENWQNTWGLWAAEWAISLGQQALCMSLIRAGLLQPTVSQAPLVNQAAAQGMVPVVDFLFSQGASPDDRDQDGWSAIHWVVEGSSSPTNGPDTDTPGHMTDSLVDLIMQYGADVNAVSLYGTSPLHCAAGTSVRQIRRLLTHGADPNRVTCHGWALIHHLAYLGNHASIQVIDAYYQSPEERDHIVLSQDNHGWSALHLAVLGRHMDTVRELLRLQIRKKLVIQKDESGRTAEDWLDLELASHTYAKLSNLAYSKSRCCRPVTGLRKAARENILELIDLLLDQGHYINGTDPGRRTALYYAASKGHLRIVELLLRRGADPNILPVGRPMWELFIHDSEILAPLQRHGYRKPIYDSDRDNQIRLMLRNAVHLQPEDPSQDVQQDLQAHNTAATSNNRGQDKAGSESETPRSRLAGLWGRFRS